MQNNIFLLKDDFTNKTVQDCPIFYFNPFFLKGMDGMMLLTTPLVKVNMYVNRDGDYDSWVYILSNPTMPHMLKIGYTKNTPDERAKQISNATGVALPYKVEWAFHCYDGFSLEQEVHHKLNNYRVNNNREFFQISLDEAKDTVMEIGKRYI